MEKKISEMTEKEILRQQLELLAEESSKALVEELPALTNAMINLVVEIKENVEPQKVIIKIGGEVVTN